MAKKTIIVERETYEKDDKCYFTYFIRGVIRGREVRVGLMPADFGGYRVLDIVFGEGMEAELAIKPYEMKDEKGKVVSRGNTFAVISTDENGDVYECPIKPSRSSDKTLLNMLVSKA